MSWSALYLTCSQPQISSTWGHRAFLTLLMDGVTRGSDNIPAKCSISHHGGRGKAPSTSLPLVFMCIYTLAPSPPPPTSFCPTTPIHLSQNPNLDPQGSVPLQCPLEFSDICIRILRRNCFKMQVSDGDTSPNRHRLSGWGQERHF